MEHKNEIRIEKYVYSIPEVAQKLGISKSKAYELAHQKDFPSFELGTRIVIRCHDFEKWVDAQINKTNSCV